MRGILVRAIIIEYKATHAICVKEDLSIIDLKRINIPVEAEEGDILNIEGSSITIEKQISKEKCIQVDNLDNVIIDLW